MEEDSSVGEHDDLGMVLKVSVDVEEALDYPNMEAIKGSAEHICDLRDSDSPNPASALELAATGLQPMRYPLF